MGGLAGGLGDEDRHQHPRLYSVVWVSGSDRSHHLQDDRCKCHQIQWGALCVEGVSTAPSLCQLF